MGNSGPRALDKERRTVLVSLRLGDDSLQALGWLAAIDSADPEIPIDSVTIADKIREAASHHVARALSDPAMRARIEAARSPDR